ncbi:hypothetical protein LTR50_004147 [Elasticomyces elasticus]|nr:hypothetical protein LTR50_004147 [Elasticomyces elasticus]
MSLPFVFPPPPPPPPNSSGSSYHVGSQRQQSFNDRRDGGRGDTWSTNGSRGRNNNRGISLRQGYDSQRNGIRRHGYSGFVDRDAPQDTMQTQSMAQPVIGLSSAQQNSASAYQQPPMAVGGPQKPQSAPYMYQQPGPFPGGAYVNPTFASMRNYSQPFNQLPNTHFQPPPVPHVQQNAYISNEPNHHHAYKAPSQAHNSLTGYASSSSHSPTPSFAGSYSSNTGQKRKREQSAESAQKRSWKTPHPLNMKQTQRNVSKSDVAPAVPSFGAPLPLLNKSSVVLATEGQSNSKTGKRRKHNQLGLTPRTVEHEDSDEAIDEEAALAVAGSALSFEYKGTVATLESPAEIAAWIAERKKQFPTQKRTEQKKLEVQKRAEERKRAWDEAEARRAEERMHAREEEEMRRRGVEEKQRQEKEDHMKRKDKVGGDTAEKTRKALEKHLRKAEKLRKLLAQSEGKVKVSTSVNDPLATKVMTDKGEQLESKSAGPDEDDMKQGLNPHTHASQDAMTETKQLTEDDRIAPAPHKVPSLFPSDNETGMVPNSEFTSVSLPAANIDKISSSLPSGASSVSPGINSDSSSQSNSDDGPEEMPSKQNGPVRVAPLKREAGLCRFFVRTGNCKYGDACKFRHALPEKGAKSAREKKKKTTEPPARKTLFQRLVEQEQEEENRLALQAIKHLGAAGFFEHR